MRKDWWIGDPLAERYIFMPGLWDVQFGIGNFQKFPSCLVNGNDYYGKEMTRSLDGSTAWGPAASYRGSPGDYPGEIINQMSRCGVNIQALDQVYAERMEYFIWSFQRNEPNPAYPCVAMVTDTLGSQEGIGSWVTRDCSTVLPVACVNQADRLNWVLGDAAAWAGGQLPGACSQGYGFGLPETGRENSHLAQVANGICVWLAIRTD